MHQTFLFIITIYLKIFIFLSKNLIKKILIIKWYNYKNIKMRKIREIPTVGCVIDPLFYIFIIRYKHIQTYKYIIELLYTYHYS